MMRYMSHIFRYVPIAEQKHRDVSVENITQPMTTSTIREQINEWLDLAEERGMASYGKSLEDADDGREWLVEVVEELVDALQYAAREIRDLREQLKTPFGPQAKCICAFPTYYYSPEGARGHYDPGCPVHGN